jgi:hypothetical protein
MKIRFHLILTLWISTLPFLNQHGTAQTKLSYAPGPANFDTARFAHIYFMRDLPDDFEHNWLGVIINDNNGMCVKADMNRIYRVNTILTGPTRFHTRIDNNVESIIIDIQPGNNYYVQLKPVSRANESVAGELTLLKPIEALARINTYPRAIQDRYCIIPFAPSVDFVDGADNDTVFWYADKKHQYNFRMLEGWDFIMRTSLRTIYGFRNDLISGTYSEAGGLLYLPLTKCKSEQDFEKYCVNKFIPGILEHGGDSITNYSIQPIDAPPGISCAKLVNIENITWQAKHRKGQPLIVRSAYIVFFWTNERGKGYSACLFESERGSTHELHSMPVLEDRIKWCWDSFSLKKWQ